jgi:hypothetical protein
MGIEGPNFEKPKGNETPNRPRRLAVGHEIADNLISTEEPKLKLSPEQVAFFGDSLTYHYNRQWPKKEKIPTANDGRYVKIGKSVSDMEKDMKILLAAGQLDKIKCAVILGGTNDLGNKKKSAEMIIVSLNTMVTELMTKNPPSLVVLSTLPPIEGYKPFQGNMGEIAAKANKVNTWIRQQAQKFPGKIILFDLENMVGDPTNPGHMSTKYYSDGLHLSKTGKAEMAAQIHRIVAENALP